MWGVGWAVVWRRRPSVWIGIATPRGEGSRQRHPRWPSRESMSARRDLSGAAARHKFAIDHLGHVGWSARPTLSKGCAVGEEKGVRRNLNFACPVRQSSRRRWVVDTLRPALIVRMTGWSPDNFCVGSVEEDCCSGME